MTDKSIIRLKQFFLLTGTVAIIGIFLIGGEIYCRLFTDINFLDNSREIFFPGKYGESYGNTPNFQGVSFGQDFTTDENGFRIDPNFSETAAPDASAILIIGDSVAFGPAVDEKKTIAGILRRSSPSIRIYNASVIGYDTFDYKNVVNSLITKKPEIKKVLLFFCLNDVNKLSAAQIRKQVGEDDNSAQDEGTSILRPVNDYLRSRSKLYLLLKNLLRDTQMIYFKGDLAEYQKGRNYVESALQPLAEIKKTLAEKNISFEVFVLPYEVQARSESPSAYLQPQQMIEDFLKTNDIQYLDLTGQFQKQTPTKKLFLYGDPMHLSEKGNRLTAFEVCGEIKEVCKIDESVMNDE